MSASVLSGAQLDRVDVLLSQAEKLTQLRDEMHRAWDRLKSVGAGSTPSGHRTFQTIASLGAQLRSVEGRIDQLLDAPLGGE